MNAIEPAILDQLERERPNLQTSRLVGSLPVRLANGRLQSPADYIADAVNSLEVRRSIPRGDIGYERDLLIDAAYETYLAMLDDDVEYEIDSEAISESVRANDSGVIRRAIADCAIDYHIEVRRSWRVA